MCFPNQSPNDYAPLSKTLQAAIPQQRGAGGPLAQGPGLFSLQNLPRIGVDSLKNLSAPVAGTNAPFFGALNAPAQIPTQRNPTIPDDPNAPPRRQRGGVTPRIPRPGDTP